LNPTGEIVVAREGSVACLRIRNPARRNAMSASMWRAVKSITGELRADRDIRVVVVRGDGDRAFSSGADLSEFDTQRSDATSGATYDELVESACTSLQELAQVTIALVRGCCVGAGNSLAASCDFRIASADAFFALPAARLGLGYDPRGIVRLVRVYGGAAARLLVLGGARLDAVRAHQLGAVDLLAPPGEVEALARGFIESVSHNAPLTIRAAKAALAALAPGVDESRLAQSLALAKNADESADYAEGRAAFAAKRPPRFEGR
jgi:enoyl-CoA hydratase/carnithine racemase